MYQAKEAIAKTLAKEETVNALAAISAWLDDAGPATPLSAFKKKQEELQLLMARA